MTSSISSVARRPLPAGVLAVFFCMIASAVTSAAGSDAHSIAAEPDSDTPCSFEDLAVAGSRCSVEESGSPGSSVSLPEPELWSDSGTRPYWRRNFFKRFLSDQKFLLATWWPSEAKRVDFAVPLAASLIAASGSDDGIDLQWQRSVEAWTGGGRRDVAVGFSRLGDAEAGIVLIGGTYLIARWAKSERWQWTASLSAEALLNTAIYSTLLKAVTSRTRPSSGNTGDFFVYSPRSGELPTSFPSGHAMGTFAVATVVAIEFRDHPWVRWAAYGTASLVALSRVALGKHFPSDVLAGAVLGHSLGRMVISRNGDGGETPAWARFEPLVGPNGSLGVTYHHTW